MRSIARHRPARLRSRASRLAVASSTTAASCAHLRIPVTGATGTGPTPIAAFDAALLDCGVGNFNLIRLSSVIPPLSMIEVASGPVAPLGGWGDRLYLVYAERGTSEPGTSAWAGLGWIQDPDTGAGLFVEHDADNEETVRADIALSLAAMAGARNVDFDPAAMVTAGIRCIDDPVAALTVAVFATCGWDGHGFESTQLVR